MKSSTEIHKIVISFVSTEEKLPPNVKVILHLGSSIYQLHQWWGIPTHIPNIHRPLLSTTQDHLNCSKMSPQNPHWISHQMCLQTVYSGMLFYFKILCLDLKQKGKLSVNAFNAIILCIHKRLLWVQNEVPTWDPIYLTPRPQGQFIFSINSLEVTACAKSCLGSEHFLPRDHLRPKQGIKSYTFCSSLFHFLLLSELWDHLPWPKSELGFLFYSVL